MRIKSFLFLSLLMIVLCSMLAWASSDVVAASIDDTINPREKASFSVNITNNANNILKYTIYSLELGQWNVEPSPLADKVITIGPHQSYVIKILVNPVRVLLPGIYFVSLNIENDLGEKLEQKLKIYLETLNPATYNPSIKVDVDMPAKINPQEPLSIKLFLENRNSLNLSGMRVRLENEELPEFAKEVVVDLPPLERKQVEFTVTPNRHQQPKEYVLRFVFERYGESFKVVEQPMEIITLLPPFSIIDTQEESSYLKVFRRFTVKNDGNTLNTQEVKVPVSFIEGLLTQGEAKVKKEAGQRYITWETTLGPNETTEKYAVTNFRLLVYALLIIIALLVFYFYVRSPILLKKTAVTLKKDEDGALSGVKVTIEVRNNSKMPVKEVTVYDLIPAYAVLEKSAKEHEEAVKPHRATHTKEGTKVSWSLMDLDAKEQRVMTYNVRAKLNILGTISLPRASAEFSRNSGRRGKAYSGVFKLG